MSRVNTRGAARLSMDQLRKFVKDESGTGKSFKTITLTADGGIVGGQSSVVADIQEDTLTLKAGDNITLTGNAAGDSITITGVSTSSNSFATIAVNNGGGGTATGDASVVADSGTDTLTLAAGSNITINANANSDTLTISSDQGQSFKTLTIGTTGTGASAGDTSIAAETINDTLTLTAGDNITLTGNASGDQITIAAADYGDAGITTFSVDDDTGNDVGNLRFDASTGISLSDASNKLTIGISDAVATQLKISGNTSGDTTISIDNHSTSNTVELVGGSNVTLTGNNSTGQITITAPDRDPPLSTEEVQDIVGAMFTGNTETNISATYQDSDGTIDLNASQELNAFTNIQVSGQPTIAADSSSDTLTLVAGSNMTIVNDVDNDTITFHSTQQINEAGANGEALISGTPVDNQLAVWVSNTAVESQPALVWDNGNTMLHVSGNIEMSGNLGVNVTGDDITHGITLPNSANNSGIVKANAYATYSSLKFKENVSEIQDPINTIMNMRGVTFDWKQNGKKDYGFIAEEVDQVMPEIVFKDDSPTGVSSMDYQKIVPVLLEAIKIQQGKIETLENKLSELTHVYNDNKK